MKKKKWNWLRRFQLISINKHILGIWQKWFWQPFWNGFFVSNFISVMLIHSCLLLWAKFHWKILTGKWFFFFFFFFFFFSNFGHLTFFAKWKWVYWQPFWNGKCFFIFFLGGGDLWLPKMYTDTVKFRAEIPTGKCFLGSWPRLCTNGSEK